MCNICNHTLCLYNVYLSKNFITVSYIYLRLLKLGIQVYLYCVEFRISPYAGISEDGTYETFDRAYSDLFYSFQHMR